MSGQLNERVDNLEKQMEALTTAVTDLTNALTSGKMAVKMLIGLIALGTSLSTFVYWIATHLTVK